MLWPREKLFARILPEDPKAAMSIDGNNNSEGNLMQFLTNTT